MVWQKFYKLLFSVLFKIYTHFTLAVVSVNRRDHVPAAVSFKITVQVIITRLHQLNLFPSDDPTTDNDQEIRNQIISTRLFILLLCLTFGILTVYASQVPVIKTVSIPNPTSEQYLHLYDSFRETLTCPCKTIGIPQHTFLTVKPTFHQVCGSSFVDPHMDSWAFIYKASISNSLLPWIFACMVICCFRLSHRYVN